MNPICNYFVLVDFSVSSSRTPITISIFELINIKMRRSTRVVAATAHTHAAALKAVAAKPAAVRGRGVKRVATTTLASATSSLLVRGATTTKKKKARKPTDVVTSEPIVVKEEEQELHHNENDSQLNIKREERVVASGADVSASSFFVKHEPHADSFWHRLCSTQELSCKLTLASGQVFSWRFHVYTQEWSGVIGKSVFALRERGPCVEFRCLHPTDCALYCAVSLHSRSCCHGCLTTALN